MRFLLAIVMSLLPISIGIWPGWLGPEWLVGVTSPNLAAASLALAGTAAVVLHSWLQQTNRYRYRAPARLSMAASVLGGVVDIAATLGLVALVATLVVIAALETRIGPLLLLSSVCAVIAVAVIAYGRSDGRRAR